MKENQCLKDQLIEEEKMRDDLDQYNRRENLEFHGIPLNPNENTNHIIKANDLMKENQCLKDQLIEEEKMRDDLDHYNRRENLEFHCIPLNPNENINHIIKATAKN